MGRRVSFAGRAACVGIGRRRNEVDAARGERVASAQPPGGEISATRGAMILDCLARVIRTGRIKTASAAEQRTHGKLVEAQQREQYRLHSNGGADAPHSSRPPDCPALPARAWLSGQGRSRRQSPTTSAAPAIRSGRREQRTHPSRHIRQSDAAAAALRRATSRAARSSNSRISPAHSAASGADAALGIVFVSKRACKRSRMSQPANSARRTRNASRASRLTKLRVTARGACFLPTTSPRRASRPVGLP